MKWNALFRAATVLSVATFVSFCCAQETGAYRLTLREAIDKGLQANLSVLVADTRCKNRRDAHSPSFQFASESSYAIVCQSAEP